MNWVRQLFSRRRVYSDLSEEIREHLEEKIEELLASGVSREEAVAATRREFGNVTLIEQDSREVWRWPSLESLFADVRYGLRTLRKNPGFTSVAVLTLALGIGANTAIFSVVYAVLLKALPYRQADRLVMVYENVRMPNYRNDRNESSPGNFSEWMSHNTSFESMAAYRNRSFNVTGTGEPLRIEGEGVSGDFFTVLQVTGALGRVFTPDEDRPGASHVVVMSAGLWKSRFGADAQILGRKILLDGESYTVVGVAPAGFHFPDPDDQLWVPMGMSPADLKNRGSHFLHVFGRLNLGVTVTQAQAEMNLMARRLTELYPETNTGQTVNVIPLQEDIAGPVRPALLVLVGAVGLVLLIACANVASLLLTRASVRHREIAIRLALGAGRSRIFRQLMTESVLLALLGCTLGLLLARSGVGALKLLATSNLPRASESSVNGPVLVFSVVISIFAGLVFGVVPALEAARGSVQDTLKGGARESAAGSRLRTRNLLLILETALGVVVVIGAGLLLRSFLRIEQVPLGFQPQGILTFRVIPRGERYSQRSQRTAFYQQAIERMEALPGVKSAAAVTFAPLTFVRGSKGFLIEGRMPAAAGQIPLANYDVVTPGYFGTMGIRLLGGRDCSWSDTPQVQRVIVINEAMAKTYWPGEDPLGKRIRQGGLDDQELPWLTIAGVVGDVREFDPMTEPRPTIYFPITQFEDAGGILRDWVVRTAGNPLGVATGVRSTILDVDKDLPVTRVRTMEQIRSMSMVSQRLHLLLFGLFAVLALVLATVGIYGVTAYSVTQRTREIGIRVALGAQRNEVMRLVVEHGVRLAALGVLLGLLGALALTRLMTSMIYGVSATDPVTFSAVGLFLAVVAVGACYVPARRAMRVDPMIALRYE
jgi:putative ABC transport system permease protein